MPTQKKYEYPKEFLTKKGTIKKSHLKKAAEFRRVHPRPVQDSVLGTQRACNPESILAAQPTAVRAGEAATAHAIDATHA